MYFFSEERINRNRRYFGAGNRQPEACPFLVGYDNYDNLDEFTKEFGQTEKSAAAEGANIASAHYNSRSMAHDRPMPEYVWRALADGMTMNWRAQMCPFDMDSYPDHVMAKMDRLSLNDDAFHFLAIRRDPEPNGLQLIITGEVVFSESDINRHQQVQFRNVMYTQV